MLFPICFFVMQKNGTAHYSQSFPPGFSYLWTIVRWWCSVSVWTAGSLRSALVARSGAAACGSSSQRRSGAPALSSPSSLSDVRRAAHMHLTPPGYHRAPLLRTAPTTTTTLLHVEQHSATLYSDFNSYKPIDRSWRAGFICERQISVVCANGRWRYFPWQENI